jgi:2-polyprenyl-3-methyl-5-hydroxy-6-metoxy-1,4-benzoquinol methylase
MAFFSRYLEQQRTRKVLPHLQGSILDIGCGSNPLKQYLPSGDRYVGVEREENILHWLEKHFPGLPFIQCDLNQQMPALNEKFDRIVMMAVIEHLDCPGDVLAQLKQFFRPGGKLVLTTPSPFGNWVHHQGAKLNLFSKLAAEEHNLILNRSQIQRLFEEAGYKLVHFETFLFFGNQLIVAEPVFADEF